MPEFLLNVTRIREEARRDIEQGAITPSYKGNKETIVKLLQGALSTEWICALRYTQHYHAAKGIYADAVAKEFKQHAVEEQSHANILAERLTQLGEIPSLDPKRLVAEAHSEYKECHSLADMIRENLIAERIAVSSYTEMINYIGDKDPTTRRIFEKILEVEEEHADELSDLLAAMDAREKTS